MNCSTSRGMTLVELLISLIITSFMLAVVGTMVITSYQSWQKEFAKVQLENELRMCASSIEHAFRSATDEPIVVSNNYHTIHFVSYFSNYSVAGLYTQHEYTQSGSSLVHNYWDSNYVAGVLTPVSPLGKSEMLSADLQQLSFGVTAGRDYVCTINLFKGLPDGSTYYCNDSIFLYSENRIRGYRSSEQTK